MEILASIALLGILSTIGIVAVFNIRENQERKFDNHQWNIFNQTAKTYFTDNKSMLPLTPGGTKKVYLKELISNGYLDSLLDYNKDSYDQEKSYVLVTKIGNNYAYRAVLIKSGKDAEEVKNTDLTASSIVFSNYGNGTNSYMSCDKSSGYTEVCKTDDDVKVYYTTKSPQVKFTASDNDKIIAYQYIIYKNNKVLYTSEFIDKNRTEVSDKFTLNTSDYSDGKYKIKVTAYDTYGFSKSSSTKEIIIDKIAPTCTTSGGSATWISSKSSPAYRTITGVCTDNIGGSGCLGNISKKYTSDMNITNAGPGGNVKDKAGNTGECQANQTVKIDKTPPTCTTSGGSSTWINASSSPRSRTITGVCTDNTGGSGCAGNASKTYTSDINTTTAGPGGDVYDVAGNKGTCAANQTVKIDTVPPTCKTSGGSSTWINATSSPNFRKITGICTDNAGGSGCVGNISTKYTSNIKTSTAGPGGDGVGGTIYDNAGNSATCEANQKVKIDLEPPDLECELTYKEFDTDGINVKLVASDTGGSGMKKTYPEDDPKSYPVTFKNLTYTQTYKAYDKAGNESGSCEVDVKRTTLTRYRIKTSQYNACLACGTEPYSYTTTCSEKTQETASSCAKKGGKFRIESSTGSYGGLGTCTVTWSCVKNVSRTKYCPDPSCGTASSSWSDWTSWQQEVCVETDDIQCDTAVFYSADVTYTLTYSIVLNPIMGALPSSDSILSLLQ